MTGTVHVEERDGARWVTLDRPPVNALSLVEYDALTAALSFQAGSPGAPRVVVLRATGRVWSAGQDVKEYPGTDPDRAAYLQRAGRAIAAAARCPVPLVVAQQGLAVGAGGLLVAVADLVVAAEQAAVCYPEVRLGVLLGMSLLEGFLPAPLARHALMTGERISAQRLHEVGAIARPVPAERVAAVTAERVEELLVRPDTALRWLRGCGRPAERAAAYEAEVAAAVASPR